MRHLRSGGHRRTVLGHRQCFRLQPLHDHIGHRRHQHANWRSFYPRSLCIRSQEQLCRAAECAGGHLALQCGRRLLRDQEFDKWQRRGLHQPELASRLRGYQLTDSTGMVKFVTIVPGWYTGRTTHIHMRFRSAYDTSSDGSTNTAQLLFDQTFIDSLDTTVTPYKSEGKTLSRMQETPSTTRRAEPRCSV